MPKFIFQRSPPDLTIDLEREEAKSGKAGEAAKPFHGAGPEPMKLNLPAQPEPITNATEKPPVA